MPKGVDETSNDRRIDVGRRRPGAAPLRLDRFDVSGCNSTKIADNPALVIDKQFSCQFRRQPRKDFARLIYAGANNSDDRSGIHFDRGEDASVHIRLSKPARRRNVFDERERRPIVVLSWRRPADALQRNHMFVDEKQDQRNPAPRSLLRHKA